jgi:hypothetical protein
VYIYTHTHNKNHEQLLNKLQPYNYKNNFSNIDPIARLSLPHAEILMVQLLAQLVSLSSLWEEPIFN